MREVVGSVPTIADAKKEALKQLGVDSEINVDFEITDKGDPGVFGWGTRPAKVKAKLTKEPD